MNFSDNFIPDWKLNKIISDYLEEDIPYWDISSIAVPNKIIKSKIYIKEQAIIVGIPIVKKIFKLLNCEVSTNYNDGLKPKKVPEIIMNVSGPSLSILSGERLVLNILGRLSSIATNTAKAVEIINLNCENKDLSKPRICATRKTTPGLRLFEKYAVFIGGGDTHRLNLSNSVMLKDNHLTFFESIKIAIQKTRDKTSFTHKIEVETTTESQAIEAAEAGADIIMLDNFSSNEIKHIINKIKSINSQILVEVSGGINLDNLKDYVSSGVDLISMGSITHTIKNIDFSLKIVKEK